MPDLRVAQGWLRFCCHPVTLHLFLKHLMKSTYRVIGFGESDHGFWNYPAFCSTIGYAQGFYNAHLNDPEMDGAVLIKVDHETWQIIQEFGTENVSVVYGPLGGFKVERAPKLVMV